MEGRSSIIVFFSNTVKHCLFYLLTCSLFTQNLNLYSFMRNFISVNIASFDDEEKG